jgi:hypothetical protein
MNARQIARADTEVLEARLNYLEAIGAVYHAEHYVSEYDLIRRELDTRNDALLDSVSKAEEATL